MILCGGRGTRLQEHTQSIPKPLVEIGGRPILWHVDPDLRRPGLPRFLLLTGYKGELIEALRGRASAWPERRRGRAASTPGLDTPTGGRIKRGCATASASGRFCATYADGVADIDLGAPARASTAATATLATMTVVRPELQFGVAELDDDGRVRGFREKPRVGALDQRRLLLLRAGRAGLHRATTASSSASRWRASPPTAQLRAFRHEGFWECMDTYKDAVLLNDLWAAGARAVEGVER